MSDITGDEARRLREAAEAPLVATVGCGCSCHRWPGGSHVVACCDTPPYEDRAEKDRRANEVIAALAATVERLTEERDRAFVALWRIRMEAERSNVNEPVWQLPNTVIHLALGGLGRNKRKAQELAAAALTDPQETTHGG